MKRRLLALLPWAMAVVAAVFLWQRGSQWYRLRPFLETSYEQAASSSSYPDDRVQRNAELKVLYSLWLQRRQRNIAPRVRGFVLKHPSAVQFRAARMLGYLEDAAALPALEQLRHELSRSATGNEQRRFFPQLDIAIGKISARRLRGRSKLERISREIGLSWADVAALSGHIDTSGHIPGISDHALRASNVIEEMLDVLAQMVREGDDPAPYAQQMSLNDTQRLYLRAAAMEDAKGIPLLLEQLTQSENIGGSLLWLEGRVVQSEPRALSRALRSQLEKMNQFRNRYPYSSGYSMMCRICMATLDRSCLPVLLKLREHPDPTVRKYAISAIFNLKRGSRQFAQDYP